MGDDKSELLGHGEESKPATSAFVRDGFGVIWTTAFKDCVRCEDRGWATQIQG